MKFACFLLVCLVAVASAAPVDFSGVNTKWSGTCAATNDDSPNSFIITDAGSSGTRIIIGIKGEKIAVCKGLPRVTDIETATGAYKDKPKVLEAFDIILQANTAINWMVVGATAGARNDIPHTNIVTSIGYLCSAAKRKPTYCHSAIMQGTTEGFLGWYEAWLSKSRPQDFCYMEFGGASAQFAVGSPTTALSASSYNVQADFKSSAGGKDTMSVVSLSGVQLGSNVINDATLNTQTGKETLTDCDATPTTFDFGKCKTAARAFYGKDAPLATCITTYTKALASCTKVYYRGKFSPKILDLIVVPTADSAFDTKFTAQTFCKPGQAAGSFAENFACGRAVMWNAWFNAMFPGSTKPTIEKPALDVEWFNGFKNLMAANSFDFDIAKALMVGQTVVDSDCIKIDSKWEDSPTSPKRLSLRLRNGRAIKNLRLRF